MYRPLLITLALVLSSALYAVEPESPPGLEPLPDAPPPPEPVQSGEPLEPEVRIVRKKDATLEEYRINGQLYMIKVTPVVGKPYFLLDQDGDGSMETNMSEIYTNFTVPQWVLFSWK